MADSTIKDKVIAVHDETKGLLGTFVGGALGFLVGGPIGMVIGAGAGYIGHDAKTLKRDPVSKLKEAVHEQTED